MAGVALVFVVVYFALVFGARTVLHRRRTGSSGFHGVSGRAGSAQWLGGVGFVVAVVLIVLAPIAQLAGPIEPLPALDRGWIAAIGVVLAVAGTLLTLAAQAAMGAAWRIGIDESERTTLVTGGPFAVVRNPVFAAMIPATAGLVCLVPNVVAFAALAALLLSLELQTRVVEEPYLLRAHGGAYAQYAARVGRFFPGVGRLRGSA
jgi:protein-S-isoprenylcysteine O-methyltransferase Ste14